MRIKGLINVCLAVVILGAALGLAGPVAAQSGLRTIPIPGALLTFKLSPDGRLAAVYEMSQFHDPMDLVTNYLPVRVVDLDSEAITLLSGPPDYVLDVAFSPDGATLAGCYGGGQIVLWDTASGAQIKTLLSRPGLQYCAFLPDGQTLAVVTPVTSLSAFLLMDTASGAITRTLSHRFERFGQFREVLSQPQNFAPYVLAAFAVTPDGRQIVTAAMNDSLWAWGVGGEAPNMIYDSEETIPTLSIRKLVMTPDGAAIVYLHQYEPAIHARRIVDAEEIAAIPLEERPYDFALAPDGDRLALAYRHGEPVVLSSLSHPESATTIDPGLPEDFELDAPTVAFATSSRIVLAGRNANGGQNALIVLDVP